MFNMIILNPKRVLAEGEAKSMFFPGDTGEFEVLTYHCPVISLLKEGHIVIDGKRRLHIKGGAAMFYKNKLVALVEE